MHPVGRTSHYGVFYGVFFLRTEMTLERIGSQPCAPYSGRADPHPAAATTANYIRNKYAHASYSLAGDAEARAEHTPVNRQAIEELVANAPRPFLLFP